MTALLLIALRDFLADRLANLLLPEPSPPRPREEKTLWRSPRVFIGALPPKNADGPDTDYPFVLLRAMGGQDGASGDQVAVKLVCGVWSPETPEAGEIDLLNLVGAVRRNLLEQRVIDRRYELAPDDGGGLAPWKKSEEQPKPYYLAEVVTRWTIPGVERLDPLEASYAE